MGIDNEIATARNGVALVGDLLKAAGDNPNAKEACNNIGEIAVTVTGTINNALLPLAALNYGIKKARAYFKERFEGDLSAKTVNIPLNELVEPKASVAGPALQGLAFTHEEPSLKDMYLSLLATAMDGRVPRDAHPAFAEIIKQLSSEETPFLNMIIRDDLIFSIVNIGHQNKDTRNFAIIFRNVASTVNATTGQPIEIKKYPAMVDNWIRLGLVEVDYNRKFNEGNKYD